MPTDDEDEVLQARRLARAVFPMPERPVEPPPPPSIEGLAYLPSLTERELQVLLVAVESRQRLPVGDESATGRILWSLHTAISEAIYAAQRETKRLHQPLDLDEQDGCPND